MTGDKSLLKDYVKMKGPTISFGDNSKGFTLGYGTVASGNVSFEDVALVEGLMHNLLSVSQLGDKGFVTNFNSDGFLVEEKESGGIVLQGVRKGNIYVADFAFANGETCFYSKASPDVSEEWHKNLSHLNYKSINDLVKRELVLGIPQMEFASQGLCSACQHGKFKKSSFHSKVTSAIKEPLSLLHMDLFGPVNVMTVTKKRYCLVIVDEFSRYIWVYFEHAKSEVALQIINHVKKVENESSVKVRVLRTDNGTEFRNSIVMGFCESQGINQEFSALRTPQQNGVVERKNRTLIEAARTMLNDSKLPTYFWPEAILTACFTENRSLITKSLNKTPYEIMKGRKPSI